MTEEFTTAAALRMLGIKPCRVCKGEGVIKARTAMLEMTAGCGRCDGTGEEPEEGEAPETARNIISTGTGEAPIPPRKD